LSMLMIAAGVGSGHPIGLPKRAAAGYGQTCSLCRTLYDTVSSMSPDRAPFSTSVASPSPLVGDWPERLRTLLRAAIDLSAPHERDDV
ncbi:hypothetical protein ABTD14_19840, partial [Acinetobacter baumannii]